MTASETSVQSLRERLRLIVITDRSMIAPRGILEVATEVLEAGAPTLQLRDKSLGAAELLPLAQELRALCRRHGALLFVNDRLDVAMAAGADGVHLGPDDLPVSDARAVAPPGFLIGYSTDDPDEARRAVAEGADYIGCGTVWPTGSKADAGDAIGPEGVRRVTRAVRVPVVAIGGISVERAAELPSEAAGAAVIGAVMAAPDPSAATRSLLEALATPSRTPSGG